MTTRLVQIKHLVWAVAVVFAVAIAPLLYALGGFGRLGSRAGLEAATHALVALGIAIATQVGLGLAPVVRSRGPWLRSAATVLMIPALVFGLAVYRDVLGRAPEQSAQPIDFVVFLYMSIVPVYVAVAVWMWWAPRAPAAGTPGSP
jgi:hypothetical protein